VYNHVELEARHEIELEKYIKKVQIEARVMGEMASTHVLPAAIRYQKHIIDSIRGLKEIGLGIESFRNQLQIVEKISEHIQIISDNVEQMIEARKAANALSDTREKAIAYCDKVKAPHFDTIRYHVDKLEMMVDDRLWELPKYRELLFMR
jgi:glutamine synthetase